MPLKTAQQSAKARKQQYMERLRADPIKYAEYKEKEKVRYQNRKEKLKPKTERGKRQQRKGWREAQERCRAKRKAMSEATNNTPPETPIHQEPLTPVFQFPTSLTTPTTSATVSAERKQRGRKKVRKDRSQAYRTIAKLKLALAKETARAEKYRKRFQRGQKKSSTAVATPRRKTNEMIGKANVSSAVKKTLLFHNVLCQSIRAKHAKTASDKEKQILTKLVTSELLRKYKLAKLCREETGVSAKRMRSAVGGFMEYSRKTYHSVSARCRQTVAKFLERDDNSRITTGRNDTVSRKGEKKQRRLLTETLQNLHAKFVKENPLNVLSYATFCLLRPYWIVAPNKRDRETCLCKIHENGNLVISRLVQMKLLPSSSINVEACVKLALCETSTQACYERRCETCASQLSIMPPAVVDNHTTFTWFQWESVTEEKMIKGKQVRLKKTVKVEKRGTAEDLWAVFQTMLKKLCWHIFVIRHQFTEYRAMKEGCDQYTCVMVIDFSENYTCEQARAVQSSHFGASNSQVSLHTGVAYMSDKMVSFCSLSDCTRHDPAAIWTLLLPVLNHIKAISPNVRHLHIWSDGPTTQYRNKQNFFLASVFIPKLGFSLSTWNFFEAGHGKGPADAVGGVLKRTADQTVDHGVCSITSAGDLLKILSEKTSVTMFSVKEEEMNKIDVMLPKTLKPVAGTMKLHQLQILQEHSLSCRNFSCFCAKPHACECFDAVHVNFPTVPHNQPDTTAHQSTTVRTTNEDSDDETADHTAEVPDPTSGLSDSSPQSLPVVGDWCLVVYDGQVYVGKVTDTEEEGGECEVSTLKCTGNNRFVYPAKEDKIWYSKADILITVTEPHYVSKRVLALDDVAFEAYNARLNN